MTKPEGVALACSAPGERLQTKQSANRSDLAEGLTGECAGKAGLKLLGVCRAIGDI